MTDKHNPYMIPASEEPAMLKQARAAGDAIIGLMMAGRSKPSERTATRTIVKIKDLMSLVSAARKVQGTIAPREDQEIEALFELIESLKPFERFEA